MDDNTLTAPSIEEFIAQKINRGIDARKTAPVYRKLLKIFEASLNGGGTPYRPISDAKRTDVERFMAQLHKSNTPATVWNRIAPLREYFKLLREQGIRTDDPTSEIPRPKSSRNTKRFVLSRSEIASLLDAPRGPYGLRDRAIIHLLYSGLKRNEIRDASLHDIDLKKRQLKVAGRVVPLRQDVADAIDAYMQARRQVKSSALFLSNRRERIGLRQVWKIAKDYILECGLNDKTNLETLRDTYVVHALEDGVDLKEIAAARGKADGAWLHGLIALIQSSPNTMAVGEGATLDASLSALLHPKVIQSSLRHFKDGDYREAVLNAMLTLTEVIREKSGLDVDGVALVSKVFKPDDPVLAFTKRGTPSERDEHAGFHKLMLGAFEGVRNPKSHSIVSDLTANTAAQYLAFISLLVQRAEDAIKL